MNPPVLDRLDPRALAPSPAPYPYPSANAADTMYSLFGNLDVGPAICRSCESSQ
jgi:hypothetical protein